MTTPQAAEIARKLTKAQRRVVETGRLYYGRGYWPLYHSLRSLGLVVDMFGHPLTPLGLAVKAVLEEERNG